MKKFALLAIVCLVAVFAAAKDEKMKPEELVAKHIAAIKAPVRGAQREVSGKARMKVVTGGQGDMAGEAQILSQDTKLKFAIRFNNPNYPGEQVVFTGDKVLVGEIRPGKKTALGDFLYRQTAIVQDGLLGGTLRSGWLLTNPNRDGKLTSEGLKKVEGRELLQLNYVPKRGSDNLTVKLYFDPATFRHVRTVYEARYTPPASANVLASLDREDQKYYLIETFDDFRSLNGVVMPAKYSFSFSSEKADDTRGWLWEIELNSLNGQPLPAAQ